MPGSYDSSDSVRGAASVFFTLLGAAVVVYVYGGLTALASYTAAFVLVAAITVAWTAPDHTALLKSSTWKQVHRKNSTKVTALIAGFAAYTVFSIVAALGFLVFRTIDMWAGPEAASITLLALGAASAFWWRVKLDSLDDEGEDSTNQ